MNRKTTSTEFLNKEHKIKLLNESLEKDLKQLKQLEIKIIENKKASKEIFIMTTLVGLGIIHLISHVFEKAYMINTIFGPMTSIQFDYITITPGVLAFSGFVSLTVLSENKKIRKKIKNLTNKIKTIEQEKTEKEQELKQIKKNQNKKDKEQKNIKKTVNKIVNVHQLEKVKQHDILYNRPENNFSEYTNNPNNETTIKKLKVLNKKNYQ